MNFFRNIVQGLKFIDFFSCMFFAKRYIYIIGFFFQISEKEINLYQVHFS